MLSWIEIEQQQKGICKRLNLLWTPENSESLIAVNRLLFSDINPINGLRHPKEKNIEGWYLWSGGEIPQMDAQFFEPIHTRHLINLCPIVLKYLGLPVGFRFQIDNKGYKDIWFDKNIL